MNPKLYTGLAVLAITVLSCGVISLPYGTPPATLPAPAVSIITPTPETPPPSATPLSPNAECTNPAVGLYLKTSTDLLLQYSQLSVEFQKHFDTGDKEAMRADLDEIKLITAAMEALKSPSLYQKYHEIFSEEIKGFTAILTAILEDRTDEAVVIADSLNQLDAERLAEARRINQRCNPGFNA